MIMYLSGNFPQLMTQGKEGEYRNKLLKEGRPYHRLVTIFYPKHVDTVLNLIKEEGEDDESK